MKNLNLKINVSPTKVVMQYRKRNENLQFYLNDNILEEVYEFLEIARMFIRDEK